MAFCTNCGAQLSDSAKFCPKCGQALSAPAGSAPTTPLAPDSAPTVPLTPPQANAAPVTNDPAVPPVAQPAPAAPAAKKKQLPKWAVVVLVVVLVAAIWWFFIRKDPVKGLKDYVFYDYGNVSFGTVVDTVLPGTKWSSSNNTVTVSGTYMMVPFTMTFQVSYMGDTPIVQFLYATALGRQESDVNSVVGSLYEMYADMMPSYNAPSGGTSSGAAW